MELIVTSSALKTLVENIKEFQALNPADDTQFEELMERLRAFQMMFDDVLVTTGDREKLTRMEVDARIRNPYYAEGIGIFPRDGLSPNRSGRKG